MNETWEQLKQTFTEEHKELTRGYLELLKLLDRRDFVAAARASAALDALAGPHIEFEERYLYPTVQESRGESYVSRLYAEHHEVLAALLDLKSLRGDSNPPPERVAAWKEHLEHGLQHAAACGSLLSHLQSLPLQRQQEYLKAIGQLRSRGRSWSEFRETKSSPP